MADHVTIEMIAQAVADAWGITLRDLRGQRRFASFVIPRHVAFALSRAYTDHSFPEIGQWFGDRDHTTVIHGIRRYERELCDTHRDLIWEAERLIELRRRATFLRGGVVSFRSVRRAA